MINDKRKVFGTDGVRGKVGEYPMTVDFTMRLASAIASVLVPNGGNVAIGKDTRVSGYMFESALESTKPLPLLLTGVSNRSTGPPMIHGRAKISPHQTRYIPLPRSLLLQMTTVVQGGPCNDVSADELEPRCWR